ncbi:MAG: DUF4973 domain-containing protein [Prevotellaceae bacterium]|nr:DUF4973 domain-containing protein [Prevotellaceae bacterium]
MKTAINKTCIMLTLAAAFLLLPATSCNEEWKTEQYEKTVSFVKSGYTEVYLKYRADGVAPYKIPVVVSGSTFNDKNVEVTVELDPDTMPDLNFGRFRNREDLYFKLLEPQYYALKTNKVTIPAGEEVALLDIDFKLQGLDLVDRHILPLKVSATSAYEPSPRKHYKKTLMRIVPFNDFSGSYTPSEGEISLWNTSSSQAAWERLSAYEDVRELRVVDDSTVFFYAGSVEETALDRARYKVQMKFNPDNTLTLWADSSVIEFQQLTDDPTFAGAYSTSTETDPTSPYLERRYTIVKMEYRFKDVTNPLYTIQYRVKCSMTMERKRNTLIPEEDQQFIFD